MDLHCHLDLYPDALKLLPEVSKRNAFTFVVTTSPRAWIATSKVFAGYENIKVGLGLHPEIVERKAGERDLFIKSIALTRFIGEIGLDGSPNFRHSLPLQESIMNDILEECEKHLSRIISLHSRGATSRVLDLLERHPKAGKPILHWFSGTINQLDRASELGCWFSVGPAMLSGEKGRSLLKRMPLDRVLPETDGPFATHNNLSLMPWDGLKIIKDLASIWNMSECEVKNQLNTNLKSLLS